MFESELLRSIAPAPIFFSSLKNPPTRHTAHMKTAKEDRICQKCLKEYFKTIGFMIKDDKLTIGKFCSIFKFQNLSSMKCFHNPSQTFDRYSLIETPSVIMFGVMEY